MTAVLISLSVLVSGFAIVVAVQAAIWAWNQADKEDEE